MSTMHFSRTSQEKNHVVGQEASNRQKMERGNKRSSKSKVELLGTGPQ